MASKLSYQKILFELENKGFTKPFSDKFYFVYDNHQNHFSLRKMKIAFDADSDFYSLYWCAHPHDEIIKLGNMNPIDVNEYGVLPLPSLFSSNDIEFFYRIDNSDYEVVVKNFDRSFQRITDTKNPIWVRYNANHSASISLSFQSPSLIKTCISVEDMDCQRIDVQKSIKFISLVGDIIVNKVAS